MPAVVRLTLSDFRCYSFLRLEACPRPVVLTGANGAGKTNILEALSFLAPGRGMRSAQLSEVRRRDAVDGSSGGAAWAVAARVQLASGGELDIGTGCDVGSDRRQVRLDGQTAKKQTALAEVISVLWLTPAMDQLFVDGAAARRRFLDRLVLGQDPAHGARATAYERALRDRARLLRDGRFDPAWLGVLEETMAIEGVAVAQARRMAATRLSEACRQGIGPFPAAALALSGGIEAGLDVMTGAEAEAWLRERLAASRRRDAESGGAAEGPHRSDLQVRHAGRDLPAGRCSTGEQKAVLVAILLAQARVQAGLHGMAPILLLDEIAAHLDRGRRAALFDELCAIGAQSWLTGTDEILFAEFGERASFFRVDDAVVTRFG